MIRERVNAGLARSVAQGETPPQNRSGDRSGDPERLAGIRKIVIKFGVGTGTVQPIKREMVA
jgi:hypothetical protein